MRKFVNASNFPIVALTVAFLFSILSLCINALATEPYDFGNFTAADSVAFVEDCNIAIPNGFEQIEEFAEFTHALVLQSYYEPNNKFHFNYDQTQKYAEDIRAAVRTRLDLSSVPAVVSEESYSLLFNTVMDENGNWVTQDGAYYDVWGNYNCYAFAIGRVENPNFYPKSNNLQYQPGDMSGAGSFSPYNVTIQQLAEIVREDLEVMGYANVSITSTIPTIDATQELICVRMGPWDYHFMRYDLETDAWYHKPGETAVLKYNTPPDDLVWYSEYSDGTGEYLMPDRTGINVNIYNSDIRYITYTKNQINVDDVLNTSINIGNWVDIDGVKNGVDVYYELNLGEYDYYDISLESEYAFEYDIYTTSNLLNTDFTTEKTGSGTSINTRLYVTQGNRYYLRINFTTDVADSVDISIIHKHNITYGAPFYILYHTVSCDCGYSCLDRHVVKITDAERAPCVLCGLTVRVEDAIVGLLGVDDIPQVA